MDLATIVGILGAIGIIIGAMVLGGDITIFVNVPSILIVIGGSILTVMIKFTLRSVSQCRKDRCKSVCIQVGSS